MNARPGWVEFSPLWGRNVHSGPADRFADTLIAKVFDLACKRLRGEANDAETFRNFRRLRWELESTKRK